jgi:hypothetical protein
LSDAFSSQSETRKCFTTIAFQLSKYAFRDFQENMKGLELNGTNQLLVYTDNVNVSGEYKNTIKKTTETVRG